MEALADPVGLWALGLGAAVIDVLDRQVELVLVAFPAAELGAAIGQHPAQPDAVLIVERHHPLVEDLGGGDRGLAVIELGDGHLGVGIDKGLLINPPDALQRADVEGVLRAAIARALVTTRRLRLRRRPLGVVRQRQCRYWSRSTGRVYPSGSASQF